MKGFPQVRVIHLSDLHFGRHHICSPEDPTTTARGIAPLRELLLADLQDSSWQRHVWATKAEERDPTPLLLAATGDFAEHARADEFDEAAALLDCLMSNSLLGTQVDRSGVFIVPGNHDVVFDQKNPEHRFAPYCNFYNRVFRPVQPHDRPFVRPDETDLLDRAHALASARVLVVEINSSYYVEHDTLEQSRGHVDSAAIARLRAQLERYRADAATWIKIALVHHHPILLPSFIEPGRGVDSVHNAKSLLRLLREHGFQLILHGHKHYPQVFSYDPDSAWVDAAAAIPQLIVAAGSCGSRGLPESPSRCNTYNVITATWNPSSLHARVQVVTRGLVRTGPDGELDPDQWRWRTLRVFDRVLSPYESLPLTRPATRLPPPNKSDALEIAREKEYNDLRFNMPVVEVLPSLMAGQKYEARAWLVQHRHHQEFPVRVTWSAGPMFPQKVLDECAQPDFAASFHYWGAMLIQVRLEFADGHSAVTHLYARLPESTARR